MGPERNNVKQEKRISKTVEQYEADWPPSDAKGFMTWLQKIMNDIPDEYLSTAKIELGSTMRYEDSYATITFSYTRMETDEEEAEREQRAAAEVELRRAREMRLLAELQAKYGNAAKLADPQSAKD
jgi:trehalose-6-phosphatase